jgi:hypothetical protein
MEHECSICLRDNKICKCGKSIWDIVRGKVNDCSIYEDYLYGLRKEKVKKK